MHDLRDRRRLPLIDVTAATLKGYGCITMLFYAVSMSVIQNGILHVSRFSNGELREMWAADADLMVLSGWAAVFQLLGGLAVPVFAFLLVEGFLHTKSFRRYLLRMLLFALVSEVPFTLAVGLIMLYGMKTFSASRVVQVLIAIAAVFWCALMKTQFGLCMILLIAVYYLLRDQKSKLWVGGVISLMYVTGPVSVFLLKRYNGRPGDGPNKYLFYCLYPLILLILGVITYVIA